MARIALAFRMLVGLSMVAGGVVLVTPLAGRLVTAVSVSRARSVMAAPDAPVATAPVPGVPSLGSPGAASAAPVLQGVGSAPPGVSPAGLLPDHAALTADAGGRMDPGSATLFANGAAVDAPTPAGHPSAYEPVPLQRGYSPPPPPGPLGSTPHEFTLPQPGMPDLYRAAHGAPPPPLLDRSRQEEFAVAGISTIDASRSAGEQHRRQPSAIHGPRSTYRVRDGDDLVGIAARFYGHPAAATAIWEANRDRLVDPGLLPIGAELQLPAPWELDLPSSTSGPAIEPRRSAVAAASVHQPGGDTPVASWLDHSAAATASSPQPVSRPVSQPMAASGGRIVVAPGETLVSLATRLYGSPGAARRIWEVNRDQLRSPELLVPGMELRLP